MNTKLKEMRRQIGLTQVQIAKQAGISTLSYQRYESGQRVPDVNTAKLIAKALNTTVEKLF